MRNSSSFSCLIVILADLQIEDEDDAEDDRKLNEIIRLYR